VIYVFQATEDFLESTQEAQLLLELATNNRERERVCSALNKAGLVLLSGKFEAFAESIAEDYVFRINEVCARVSDIPLVLRVQHTLNSIGKIDRLNAFERRDDIAELFGEIGRFWDGGTRPPQLNIDCKFSYGKHGEKELRNLFRIIGVQDVFELVGVHPSEAPEVEIGQMDFKGVFNSMTNIRNNILHQDATPTLTTEDVITLSASLSRFAITLDAKLGEMLPQAGAQSLTG
jgi:hypothetical protein